MASALEKMSSKRSSSTAPSSSSVAIIEGNNDLLIEILVLLPVKSLVRFKAVSKRWRSLISAPSFCHEHTLHQPLHRRETQPLLMLNIHGSDQYLIYNPTVPRFFPSSFPLGFSEVQILQSCNGLLLLRCRKVEEGNRRSYHVFNPTTMQQRDLSPLPTCSFVGAIYLMFDPSLSSHYRVVCFAKNETRTLELFYVYDSETQKWKLGGERKKSVLSFGNGIYFNGGIYFINRIGSSSRFFDPDNNHVSKIPSPTRHYSHEMRLISNEHYVVESNGVLHCLSFPIEEGSCRLLNVSEMKENENRWSNKYQVDMKPILAACCEQARNIRFLSIFRGEKEQDSLLILCFLGKKIVIYRFYDKVFEVQDHASEVLWDFYGFFIRSLVPV